MSTPGTTDTPTFEQKVNEVASQFEVAEDGKLQLPDGVEADEATLYAATLEKRRRDTQATFTKAQQENKRLTKENEVLATKWEEDAVKQLSSSEQTELTELKNSDPDAWHDKLVSMKEAKKQEFAEKRASVTQEVTAEEELAMREQELEMFNSENPEMQITDDLITNDIPPRITKKLETGAVTFSEFLAECKTYLGKGKAIEQPPKPDDSKDLSNIPGSREPSEEAKRQQSAEDYGTEIY